MPVESNNNDQSTKPMFIGLQSYSEVQANSFFGRDTEIDTLTRQIQLNTLTIVFGKSGTGKTSLLNAGVFPRLRKNFCLPFRIRLEFNENSPDLISQIKNVLKQEIDKYGFKVESYPGNESLWEYFHKEHLWKTVTPIIVFDQFEEIFTLAKSSPRWAVNEMPLFWEELSYLAENNIPEKLRPKFLNQKEEIEYNYKRPKAKIVFSFREEYLPEFENIAAIIPSLKTSRFRLMQMNGNQAYEVITKTWQENIKPSEARRIVSYLTKEPNKESFDLVTVEPSLLSQVCAFIDKERLESGGGKVSAELLSKYPEETIFRTIYEETISAGKNALPVLDEKEIGVGKNKLREFVEEKLITTEGYRLKYNLAEYDTPLRRGIDVLVGRYFLREDDNAVELTHDALTPIIKSDREVRRNELAMIEEKKKAKEKQKKIIKFALAVAGLIFAIFLALSFIADLKRRHARQLQEDAETKVRSLEKAILRLRLDSIGLARNNDGKNIPYRDTCAGGKKCIDSIQKLRLNSLIIDSTLFADYITSLHLIIKGLRDSLRDKTVEIGVLKKDTVILRDTIKHLRLLVITNQKDYRELQELYDTLFAKYERQSKEIDTLRKQLADCIRNCQFPPAPKPFVDTSKCLKLELNYSSLTNYYPSLLPDNLKIYLVPFTIKNQALIKEARSYDRIDESRFERAEGSIRGQFNGQQFIFANLRSGQKYLLKVCTLYGNYEIYNRTTDACEVRKMDAVPAVKGKDR